MKRGAWIVLAALAVVIAVAAFVSLRKNRAPAAASGLHAIEQRAGATGDAVALGSRTPELAQAPATAVSPPARSGAMSPSPLAATKPAPQSLPAATPAPDSVNIQIEEVHTTIRDYRLRFGGNPVGTNAEITAALNGKNPGQTDFLTGREFRRNGSGELIDRWGTPYFFHQVSGEVMEVRSAGPDRVMWTDDDRSM